MSGYEFQNIVFSFRRSTVNDESAVMSSGRLFCSFGSAEANDQWLKCKIRGGERYIQAWELDNGCVPFPIAT